MPERMSDDGFSSLGRVRRRVVTPKQHLCDCSHEERHEILSGPRQYPTSLAWLEMTNTFSVVEPCELTPRPSTFSCSPGVGTQYSTRFKLAKNPSPSHLVVVLTADNANNRRTMLLNSNRQNLIAQQQQELGADFPGCNCDRFAQE